VAEPGVAAAVDPSVKVRYFAAARAASGVDEERFPLPQPATLAALLDTVRAAHGEALTTVLARCSYLVDEVAGRDGSVLAPGAEVDILPPFAGG